LTFPLAAGAAALGANNELIASFAKTFAELPARSNGTNTFRPILDGMTSSGDHIVVHETTLAPGTSPHPPHRHRHEELFLMIRGQLAVTVEGNTSVIGPGGAAYVSSNQLHGAHNPGSEPAQYFVVATGVS
jgi:quercetin dioxygenase-like cupin family protein